MVFGEIPERASSGAFMKQRSGFRWFSNQPQGEGRVSRLNALPGHVRLGGMGMPSGGGRLILATETPDGARERPIF